jgi:hypothetical protein
MPAELGAVSWKVKLAMPPSIDAGALCVTSPLINIVPAPVAAKVPELAATSTPPVTAGPPITMTVYVPEAPGARLDGPEMVAVAVPVPPEWHVAPQVLPDVLPEYPEIPAE